MSHRIAALAVACAGFAVLATHQAMAQGAPAARAPEAPAVAAAAVADPGRPAADTKRDATRHPAEVLVFAGIRPGLKIAELVPGGGYFTRLLAKAVGPTGHVYAIVPAIMGDKGLQAAKDMAAAYPNVSVVVQTGSTFTLPEKVDRVWTSDNYHDFHNPMFGPLDMAVFNKTVFDVLKPGGVYVIEDYYAAAGAGFTQTNSLHRVEESALEAEVKAAGFVLERESKVLNNPKDDHTLRIFDPTIRGEADQFVLRFRKPQ